LLDDHDLTESPRRETDAGDDVTPSAPNEELLANANDTSQLSDFSGPIPTVEELQNLVALQPEGLRDLLNDASWATLVENLSPREFCATVSSAGRAQGPKVAQDLARAMYPALTTRHLLAVLYTFPESSLRIEVVRLIAPLTSDLPANMALIEQELSAAELAHLRAIFRNKR
jgi:hypothetical protein